MSPALNWISLIKNLASLPSEEETIEFKENNGNPQTIGEDISALSNMAALLDKDRAYMVWGISDKTHELVGTSFSPRATKVGNEELENWLSTQLYPRLYIEFHEFNYENKKFVILEVENARTYVTRFKSEAYCRVKSYTKPLKTLPLLEKKLWAKLEESIPEDRLVAFGLNEEELSNLLSFETYFKTLGTPIPSTRSESITRLINDRFIKKTDDGFYSITTMGALLLANDLSAFPTLGRKQITVTLYEGDSKIQNRESQEFKQGYLLSFENAIRYIKTLALLKTEVNQLGYTVSEYSYPEIAIREALLNTIVHQDLLERGAGPMVSITNQYIEFSNPGSLRVDLDHLIDTEPIAENERLSAFLRRVGIGDAKGTGFDKIEASLEANHMPSPVVRELSNSVSVYIYKNKPFSKWTQEEKMNALYYHAALRYYSLNSSLTNETLRERFGLSAKEKSVVSRLIKTAIEQNRIKPLDVNAADRNRSYVPYWA
mgnify:CR=1 FL=1